MEQVPETLSNSILCKVKANPKADDVPDILPEQLLEADALAGKPAGIFWTPGFYGGGQELTATPWYAIFSRGYTVGSGMFETNEVKGGSSYGAGTIAADGSRQPTELELQQAFFPRKDIEI
ncbi:hypothetical protein Peur_002008 [Populus x canadensis]